LQYLSYVGAVLAERRRDQYSLRAEYGNLVHAQNLEHYRIARELHDNILQRLTLVAFTWTAGKLRLLSLQRRLFNNVYDQISDISKRIRDLSHDLHPFMLEYLGLPRALRKLCRDSSARSGPRLNSQNMGDSSPPVRHFNLHFSCGTRGAPKYRAI